MAYETFTREDIEELFHTFMEHAPEHILEESIREYGSLEAFRENYVTKCFQLYNQPETREILLESYGDVQGVLNVANHPVGQQGVEEYQKKTDEIQRQLVNCKREGMKCDALEVMVLIGAYAAAAKKMFALKEERYLLLQMADTYQNYEQIAKALDEDLTEEQKQGIEDYLDGEEAVVDYMFTYQQMMDASTTGTSYDVYLFAVDDVEEFGRFVDLRHRWDHSPVELDGSGVVIDEKLSELLDVSVGDTITLEGDQRVEAVVADITENYVYHYVYLTRDLYTQLYGEDYQNNVMLLAYQDGMGVDVSNQTSETLMKMDGVASYSYIATIRDSFADSMDAINYAVVIIIVAAAALAFVVLYNLTNINITERRSELATLKVLGFYDGETTAYVLRENVFLTIFGVILGLVLGRFLHSWMVLTVEVDLVMFGRTAPPYAYVLAAALTALFSLIVNVAAHFRLKKIDMVESLKTVE